MSETEEASQEEQNEARNELLNPVMKERLRALFLGEIEDDDGELITEYRERLENFSEAIFGEKMGRSIIINYFEHIPLIDRGIDIEYEESLQYLLSAYPELVTKEIESVAFETLIELHGDEAYGLLPIYIRYRNVNPFVKGLEEFRADRNGRLIEIVGTIIQASEKQSVLVVGKYICTKCGTRFEFKQPYTFKYKAPTCPNESCPSYGKAGNHILLDIDSSRPVDYQEFYVQPRFGAENTNVKTMIKCIARDDIVEVADAGDEVRITGIVKTSPKFTISKDFFGDPKLEQVLYISHVERVKNDDNIEYHFTEEDFEAKVRTPEDEERWWNEMIDLIAPSIKGMHHIKEAVLLQLFSGVEVISPDGTRRRGRINVLVVGDPGTGKSTIGQGAKPFCSKYQYLSTQNATAAGMTAAVVKEGSGPWMVMAGATVLADGGMCVIDEFEKMKPEDMTKLHEQLASQKITVRKAGIHKTLSANCDVLALANPKSSRFDPTLGLSENLKKIPSSIYNRFDLIFTVPDEIEEERDREIIRHMILGMMNGENRNEFMRSVGINDDDIVEDENYAEKISFMREYISYMRKKCDNRYTPDERKRGRVPIELSMEAARMMEDFFIEIRQSGYREDAPIPISKRAGESIYRLASARAKAAGRSVILRRDMECILRLYRRFIDDIFRDPETGELDSNRFEKGTPSKMLDGEDVVLSALVDLDSETNGRVTEEKFIEYLVENSIVVGRTASAKKRAAKTSIRRLLDDGSISFRNGYLAISEIGKRKIKKFDRDDDLFGDIDIDDGESVW